MYLNDDKHYELYDEIIDLTDKLYRLKVFSQDKRRKIFDLIAKVQEEEKEEEESESGVNRNS